MSETPSTLKPTPVRRRSAARLAAVQMSYQGQMSGQSVADFLPVFLQHYSEDIRKSFRVKDLDSGHLNELVMAVEARRDEFDGIIAACLAEGWTLERMTVIDRAVLRAGTCELVSMPHLPARAVVSEYAALADVCGCDVGFINAVLDRVASEARRVEMEARSEG
jgi:N utilization substance protein B